MPAQAFFERPASLIISVINKFYIGVIYSRPSVLFVTAAVTLARRLGFALARRLRLTRWLGLARWLGFAFAWRFGLTRRLRRTMMVIASDYINKPLKCFEKLPAVERAKHEVVYLGRKRADIFELVGSI